MYMYVYFRLTNQQGAHGIRIKLYVYVYEYVYVCVFRLTNWLAAHGIRMVRFLNTDIAD